PVALDLPADLLGLHVEAREDLLDDVLALPEDAQEQVLGLDHLGAQLRGLVAREEQSAARFLVVFLKHGGGVQPPCGRKGVMGPWGEGSTGFILAQANGSRERFLPVTS